MNEVIILEQFLSIPWWILLHCIGVLNNFFNLFLFFLFDFCGILAYSGTAESSLIVQWRDLFFLLTDRLLRAEISRMRESTEVWRSKTER
jgi:hypothetical protein